MRYSRPFQSYLIINNRIFTKIKRIKLFIYSTQNIRCKRLSGSAFFMRNLFKLSKHSLSEKCCPELLKKIIYQIFFLIFRLAVFNKVINQKSLITRRSNFGYKYFISCIYIRLISVGIISMKRMTHLVCKSKYTVKVILMI